MNNIPTSKFKRGKVIAKTAINIGAKRAVQFVKKEPKEKVENEIGKILFENIALLKGTAVKIAQTLSMHNILPKSIQKELSKSYNNITPINRALVIKIIKNEFKKDYNKIFKEFNLTPFASASLGQVHLATLKNNTKVAVKIQYPSIDKTIKSDISLFKSISVIRKEILPIINEVQERLFEEIDYNLELTNTNFANRYLSSDDIIIPYAYKEYSTKHILTTTYIDGLDIYKWLKTNPSKDNKTKVANIIFKAFVKSLFELKTIQADPNPGNYIITSNNKVAIIDFGCVKRFDDKFIKEFKNLIKIYKSSNIDEILKAYKDIGLIGSLDIDKNSINAILEFNRWAIEPYLQDSFKFSKEWLDLALKYSDIFTKKPFSVVRDYIFIDRTMHGLFSLFYNMDVVIDTREFRSYIWEE